MLHLSPQPLKNSLLMGHSLPAVEEKEGFWVKQGYADLTSVFPGLFSYTSSMKKACFRL